MGLVLKTQVCLTAVKSGNIFIKNLISILRNGVTKGLAGNVAQ